MSTEIFNPMQNITYVIITIIISIISWFLYKNDRIYIIVLGTSTLVILLALLCFRRDADKRDIRNEQIADNQECQDFVKNIKLKDIWHYSVVIGFSTGLLVSICLICLNKAKITNINPWIILLIYITLSILNATFSYKINNCLLSRIF